MTTGAGTFRADALAQKVPKRAWQQLSAGRGAKGHRFYDWAVVDLAEPAPGRRQLLIRRNRTTGELAYYRCHSIEPTPLATLVRVAGSRWRVEETFQAEKGLAGLDEHQVRRYCPWTRWVTLAMLAHAFLAVLRAYEHAQNPAPDGLIPLCPATRSSASSSRSPSNPSTTWPTGSAGPTGAAAISSDHAPAITDDKPQLGHEDHDVEAATLPTWPRRMRSNQSAVSSAHRPGEPATWSVPATDPWRGMYIWSWSSVPSTPCPSKNAPKTWEMTLVPGITA